MLVISFNGKKIHIFKYWKMNILPVKPGMQWFSECIPNNCNAGVQFYAVRCFSLTTAVHCYCICPMCSKWSTSNVVRSDCAPEHKIAVTDQWVTHTRTRKPFNRIERELRAFGFTKSGRSSRPFAPRRRRLSLFD